MFTRFKLHYDFKEIFCSPRKGNEKGSVEAGVRYMRKNLLVPVPYFKDFNQYNIELLKKYAQLHNRKHYITDNNICDLHFDDINELNPLPIIPFEIASIKKRKLDNFGRLIIDNKNFTFASL